MERATHHDHWCDALRIRLTGTLDCSVLTFMLVLLLGVGVGIAVVMLAARDDESTRLQQTNHDRIRPTKSASAAPEDHHHDVAALDPAASATGGQPAWTAEATADPQGPGRRRGAIPDDQIAIEGSFAEVATATAGRRVRSAISLVVIAVISGAVIAGTLGVLALAAGALLDRAV